MLFRSGNDTINTGLGFDSVDGGADTDLLIVDYSSNTYSGAALYSSSGTNLTSNSGGGFDGYFYSYYNSSSYDWISFSKIELFQITGTGGSDIITTGDGPDTIRSGAGNDTISANSGNDSIEAGAGNDSILAGSGNDFIDAGEGNDWINPGAGDNSIQSGAGDDTIASCTASDSIDGGAGLDVILDANLSTAASAVTLNDLASSEPLPGTNIRNIEQFTKATLTAENDSVIFSTRFNSNLSTGAGNDTINTGLGIDTVDGGADTDLLIVDYSGNTYSGAQIYSSSATSLTSNSSGGFDGYFGSDYNSSGGYDRIYFSKIEQIGRAHV